MHSGPIQSKSVDSCKGIGRLLMGTFWIGTIIIHRTQKKPVSGVDLTTANFYDPLPYLHATYSQWQRSLVSVSLAAAITLKYWALVTPKSKTSSAGFFVFCFVRRSPKSHWRGGFTRFHHDSLWRCALITIKETMTSAGELSSYFIKMPALCALFGVVSSSPSNKQ